MKTTSITTCLSLCALSFALADEKPQIAGPCKEAPQIVRPIGRIGPVENAEPETEAIPKDYAEEKTVAIKFEDLKPVGERLMMKAVLRITNPTDQPITFTGFSEKSPITKVEHWKDGKWVEQKKVLRCGTGLRQCTIAPGQSAVFEEAVYAETMPTRIGIIYTGKGKAQFTVWSEKIER